MITPRDQAGSSAGAASWGGGPDSGYRHRLQSCGCVNNCQNSTQGDGVPLPQYLLQVSMKKKKKKKNAEYTES